MGRSTSRRTSLGSNSTPQQSSLTTLLMSCAHVAGELNCYESLGIFIGGGEPRIHVR